MRQLPLFHIPTQAGGNYCVERAPMCHEMLRSCRTSRWQLESIFISDNQQFLGIFFESAGDALI